MTSDDGKVFVGGVSWDTTKEGLKAYFEKFGEVTDTVIMTDAMTQKPRGFGFVTFKDPSVIPDVCTKDHVLDAKKIDPKPATARPTPTATGIRAKKVFVGGVSQGTTPEELTTFFSQYGVVTEIDLKFDRDTNRMRGFGFVAFDSEDVVDKLVETHYVNINGKSVEIKKAEANQAPNAGSSRPQRSNYGGGGQASYTAGGYGGGYAGYQQQGGYGYGAGSSGYGGMQQQANYGQQQQQQVYGQYGQACYAKDSRTAGGYDYSTQSWPYATAPVDTTGYQSTYQQQGHAATGSGTSSYNRAQQRYQPYSR